MHLIAHRVQIDKRKQVKAMSRAQDNMDDSVLVSFLLAETLEEYFEQILVSAGLAPFYSTIAEELVGSGVATSVRLVA
jgi:hypothetical protein